MTNTSIPVPINFRELAQGKSMNRLKREFRIGTRTCANWLIAVGLYDDMPRLSPQNLRQMPEDFPEQAAIFSNNALRDRYKSSDLTLDRWRRECGVPARNDYVRGRGLRPAPEGFTAIARTMSKHQLKSHYKTADETLTRWLRETGVCAKICRTTYGSTPAMQPTRDVSIAALAAEHLRKWYPNVYSAKILSAEQRKKLPNKGEGIFIVSGKGALPADEVIALAERKGFDPGAWAYIPAPKTQQQKELA